MKPLLIALANSEAMTLLALENVEMDHDGWALIAPFGEHPKSRMIRQADGSLARQDFVQVLDNDSAAELLKSENGFFRKLRRAVVGIPVFKGHPDLAQHAPETITDHGSRTPAPIGVLDNIRLSGRGVEAHFTLTPDGAAAVENEGFKHPSILWLVKPVNGLDNAPFPTDSFTHSQPIRVKPFKILSIGLTPHPNISGVDSLANASAPAAIQKQKPQKDPMKQLIIGWLAAQGTVLANDASDQSALDALQKLWTEKTGEATALGNSKQTLDGEVNRLKANESRLTTQLTESKTALENAKTEYNNAITIGAAHLKGRAEALVDLAIQQGKFAVSEREAQVTTLANSKAFDADAKKLTDLPVKHKLAGVTGNDRKEGANLNRTAQEQILILANTDERYKTLPWDQAWNRILADNPALKEQLKPTPTTK